MVRHRLVKDIIVAYDKFSKHQKEKRENEGPIQEEMNEEEKK